MCLFCGTGGSGGLGYSRPRASLAPSDPLQGPADVILRGGDIVTMDGACVADAMSVRNGLVQSIGALDAVLAHKGRCTRMIDLDGRAVAPGFVMPQIRKDPVDFLDWQVFDPEGAGGDLRGHLERSIATSLFAQPLYIKVWPSPGEDPDLARLLRLMTELFGTTPMAVWPHGGEGGYVNPAMLARAGGAKATAMPAQCGDFLRVEDIAGLLRPLAKDAGHTVKSLARLLSATVDNAASRGYTTLVDRELGSVAGAFEISAASQVMQGRRRARLHGAAHRRLREEWDGALPAEIDPAMLCVSSALVDLREPSGDAREEVAALDRAGWRIVFTGIGDHGDIDTVLELCAGLTATAASGRCHRIETNVTPDERQKALLNETGLVHAPYCDAEAVSAARIVLEECADGSKRVGALRSLTTQAAGLGGVDHVAGVIAVGRKADFALLDNSPLAVGPVRVCGTWVEGIPV